MKVNETPIELLRRASYYECSPPSINVNSKVKDILLVLGECADNGDWYYIAINGILHGNINIYEELNNSRLELTRMGFDIIKDTETGKILIGWGMSE